MAKKKGIFCAKKVLKTNLKGGATSTFAKKGQFYAVPKYADLTELHMATFLINLFKLPKGVIMPGITIYPFDIVCFESLVDQLINIFIFMQAHVLPY